MLVASPLIVMSWKNDKPVELAAGVPVVETELVVPTQTLLSVGTLVNQMTCVDVPVVWSTNVGLR